MSRRLFVSSLFAAAALPVLAAPPPPAPATQRTRGVYGITRHRFGINQDWLVPHVKVVETMPFNRTFFQDNADFTLQGDGKIRCNTQGLYRVLLGLDWKAQAGLDIDRRMIGVRLNTPTAQDVRLGSIDTPAADAPRVYRYSDARNANFFSVAPGGYVSLPIVVENAQPGDHVSVSHTGLSDPRGTFTGVVVEPNTVRVTLTNSGTEALSTNGGTLTVLVVSHTLNRGESNDAWNVLNCPLEELFPGDVLYACVRTIVPGDYIQATDRTTFMQIERFG